MTEPLSDVELLELVQEKPAEDLTEDELSQLRQRLHDSPELQQTMIDQLHMESYLHAVLGEIRVSADSIFDRIDAADAQQKARWRSWPLGFGLMFLLGFLAVGGYLLTRGDGTGPAPDGDVVADNSSPGDGPADSAGEDSTATDPAGDGNPATDETAAGEDAGADREWLTIIEAEDFDDGNVGVKLLEEGAGIGIIHTADDQSAFAEYRVDVPHDGVHQLELRYAASSSRPLSVVVNGQLIRSDAAGADTGGTGPAAQQSETVAHVQLKAGENLIRLESDQPLPYLDKIGLVLLPEARELRQSGLEDLPVLALNSTPEPPEPPVTIDPGEPWAESLAETSPRHRFEEMAFRPVNFDPEADLLADDLQRWFEKVNGESFRVFEERYSRRNCAGLEGLARLRAPWPQDAVLRMSAFDNSNARLHFLNGPEGVMLQLFDQCRPMRWGAWRTRRESGQTRPVPVQLLATDGGRHQQANFGVFEIRHQESSLVLTRGDVRLLTIPLAERPTEVLLDGRFRFSEFTMYRGESAPQEPLPPRRMIVDSPRPEELKWVTSLDENGRWSADDDGGMKIESRPITDDTGAKEVWAATLLDRPGLYEVIMQVADPVPGTGVYLGDAEGQPGCRVAFLHDRPTGKTVFNYGWTTLGPLRHRNAGIETDHNEKYSPIPLAGSTQWLRLILGYGGLRLATSADGVHWGMTTRIPIREIGGQWSSVGLFARAEKDSPPRSLKLKSVQVRELSGITGMAPPELVERARQQIDPEVDNLADWSAHVMATSPVDVHFATWRTACAIAQLEAGVHRNFSHDLFHGLLEDAVLTAPPEAARQLISDIALVGDFWQGHFAVRLIDAAEQLAARQVEQGDPNACITALTHLVRIPIWTESRLPLLRPSLLRRSLLDRSFAGQWHLTSELADRLEYWKQDPHPVRGAGGWERVDLNLLEWAKATAARHLPQQIDVDFRMTGRWRHPLMTELSKEGFNVMAELESALASRAYGDACQIITGMSATGILGLLPDSRDPELMVSLPRAVALAMREHPQFRETMQEKFGGTGLVRVRQAIQDGDVEALLAAAIQFYGTEAAAEAHRWLGDRALSVGKFAQSLDHYREAVKSAGPALTRELVARQKLAAAMMGRDAAPPELAVVELGDQSLPLADFEKLTSELAAARRDDSATTQGDGSANLPSDSRVPAPGRYKAVRRAKFDGQGGRKPGSGEWLQTDWAGRQLAVAVDGNRMYVNNRFQLAAYDATSGARIWSRSAPDPGDAHAWPLIDMQPVVVGDRLYARHLTRRGPALACLETVKGTSVWSNRPDHHVASDPVFIRGELLALVVTAPQQGVLQIDLTRFHPETGAVLAQRRLVRMRDAWSGRPPCRMTVAEGHLLCTVGGSVLRCDLRGNLQWLHEQTWLPPDADRDWRYQSTAAPLVAGGRVFVTQPGVRAVTCLELESGRRLWHLGIPGLRRLIGVVEDESGPIAHELGRIDELLVFQHDGGFTACDVRDGSRVWEHPAEDVLHGVLSGSPGGLMYARRIEVAKGRWQPMLVWVSPLSGLVRTQIRLAELENTSVQLGPFVRAGERLWAFHGTDPKSPFRDLVELVLTDEELPGSLPIPQLAQSNWTAEIDLLTQLHVATALPEWTLLTPQTSSGQDAELQLVPERHGRNGVLRTRSHRRPIHFQRSVMVPSENPGELRLLIGHDAGLQGRLRVRGLGQSFGEVAPDGSVAILGGDRLPPQSIELNEETAKNPWQEVTVDLAPHAGELVWVIVTWEPDAGQAQPGNLFWALPDAPTE